MVGSHDLTSHESITQWIEHLTSNRRCSIIASQSFFDKFGLPQGLPLSCIFFNAQVVSRFK